MDPDQAVAIRGLLRGQRIAALGTLHEGAPFVSMVPFALLPQARGFVIHVSQLASHTRDMIEDPRVSLLIVAPETPGTPPQATARITVRGTAGRPPESDPGQAAARQAYLERFPEAAPILELGDFSFFVLRPLSVRFVGGFAQAGTLTPEMLRAALEAE